MKKWVIGAIVVVLLAGGTYALLPKSTPADAPAQTGPKEPVKGSNRVIADGRVLPTQRAALTFPQGGIVAEVQVKEGDVVTPGQVLARLTSAQQAAAVAGAEAQLTRARARVGELQAGPRPQEVASARASVTVAESQLAKARQPARPEEVAAAETEVRRAEERIRIATLAGNTQELTAAQAALTTAQVQLARAMRGPTAEDLAVADADVTRARAQLELTLAGTRLEVVAQAEADALAAQHALDQAKAALASLELRAPFGGTVASVDLKAGEFAAPGSVTVRIANLSAWEIETENLSEIQVARITSGATVKLTFDAVPGLELTGKVTRIKGFGEKKQGDMTYTVLVTPDRGDERLRWNMTTSVEIQTK